MEIYYIPIFVCLKFQKAMKTTMDVETFHWAHRWIISRKGVFGAPSYICKTWCPQGPWEPSWCTRPMWAPSFAIVVWCSRTTFLLVNVHISIKVFLFIVISKLRQAMYLGLLTFYLQNLTPKGLWIPYMEFRDFGQATTNAINFWILWNILRL